MLGLGAGHLMAQGGYYPGSPYGNPPATPPLPAYTFTPDGAPIVSSADLNFINTKLGALFPTKSLILPPPAGLSSPTDAEYQAAVAAAAKDAVDGLAPGGVSVLSLSGEVARYRSATLLVPAALGALASGVINSTAPVLTRQTNLEDIARGVMQSNPGGIGLVGTTRLIDVFDAAAKNADFNSGVGGILKAALDTAGVPAPGMPAGSPAASTLTPEGVRGVVADAIAKIYAGSVVLGVPVATVDNIIKTTIAGATGAIGSPTVANNAANLDAASRAAMSWLTTYGLGGQLSMAQAILAAVPGATAAQEGAIAQGALRFGANNTIVPAFATSYAQNIVNNGNTLVGAPAAGPWAPLVGTPESKAAAVMVRFGNTASNTSTSLNTFFTTSAGPLTTSGEVRAVLEAAAGANQAYAQLIATTSASPGQIVGAPPTVASDVAFGAIRGARVADAGAIATAVVALPSVNTDPLRSQVAVASVQAVGAAGVADVSYNVAKQLKLAGGVGLARNTAVMNATQAALTPADAYISVISYLAGNFKTNPTLASTAAPTGSAAGDAAIVDANALINTLQAGTIYGLSNYDKTYGALISGTTNTAEKTRGLLLAASQANSLDVVGALAAATLNPNGQTIQDLTNLAVNANRSQQFSLTLGAAVANELNTNPAANIQQYVGRQLINNPSNTNVSDILTAATVVKAQFSHFIAHTASFNAPANVHTAIGTILNHSRISRLNQLASQTNPAAVDALGAGGRPAAIAAIAAGLTTGIRENTQITGVAKTNALYNVAYNLINQVYTTGNAGQYNDVTPGAGVFRQRTISGGVPAVTLTKATGIAGAVTGYVAQMVQPGAATLNSDLANALKGMAQGVNGPVGIAPGGIPFILTIAQAAGQAYGWVSGIPSNPALETAIATAITGTYGGLVGGMPILTAVNSAVSFGFSEANGGDNLNVIPAGGRRPGAGAAGLRDNSGGPLFTPSAPYYDHKSATGTPVSNIFTL